ncbi:hypothetical protein [Chelativorans alearense]|uniref:hypothetical protein n=1 Tax=Chelativorans alearense TaxID=2681495 RepID=UPI0013D02AF4|nr:hypothetical protein [Chelativorans alearense]
MSIRAQCSFFPFGLIPIRLFRRPLASGEFVDTGFFEGLIQKPAGDVVLTRDGEVEAIIVDVGSFLAPQAPTR